MKIFYTPKVSFLPVIASLITLSQIVPVPAFADDLTNTCGSNPGSGPTTQLTQYCQAASTGQQGATAHDMAGHLWSAVSVVCLQSCLSPAAAGGNMCNLASTGAGVLTGQAAQQLSTSFQAINPADSASTAASGATSGAASTASAACGQTGAEADAGISGTPCPPKNNTSACQTAAQSAAQAVEHYSQQQSNSADAAKNLQYAQSLASIAGVAAGTSGNTASGAGDAGSPFASNGVCGAAKSNGNVTSYTQCATAADSSLPSVVTTPAFANAFQNASGQPLSQFLAQSASPAQSIASAAAGGVGKAAAFQAGTAIAEVQTEALKNNSASNYAVYAAAGSGKKRTADSAEPNISDMMANLLGQMNGNKDGQSLDGTSSLNFAKAYRSPATVAENRALSIFDRVSYRYSLVTTRMR